MALIVAGAPGQDRPESLFQIISIAQSLLPPITPSPDDDSRPSKRLRLSTPSTRLDPPYLARPIPILPSLPDFLLPSTDPSHQHPFIVRSAASEWTAIEKWNDVEYLRSIDWRKRECSSRRSWKRLHERRVGSTDHTLGRLSRLNVQSRRRRRR